MKRGRGGVAHAARGQLSAGGVDVAPARASDEGVDAFGFEYPLERPHALFRRRAIGQLVRGVVRDEVYFGAELMSVEKACQPPRVLVRIINAVEQDVLEREALA